MAAVSSSTHHLAVSKVCLPQIHTYLSIMVTNVAALLLAPALALAAAIPDDQPQYTKGDCQLYLRHVQRCPPTDKPDGDTYYGFTGTDIEMWDGGTPNTEHPPQLVRMEYEYHPPGQPAVWKTINKDSSVGLEDTGDPKGSLANFNTGMGWLTITIPHGDPWTLQFDGFGDQHWNSSLDDEGKSAMPEKGATASCTDDSGGWRSKYLGRPPNKPNDLTNIVLQGFENELCKEAPTACEKAPKGDLCKLSPEFKLRVSSFARP
jgi:hypothetical protein